MAKNLQEYVVEKVIEHLSNENIQWSERVRQARCCKCSKKLIFCDEDEISCFNWRVCEFCDVYCNQCFKTEEWFVCPETPGDSGICPDCVNTNSLIQHYMQVHHDEEFDYCCEISLLDETCDLCDFTIKNDVA